MKPRETAVFFIYIRIQNPRQGCQNKSPLSFFLRAYLCIGNIQEASLLYSFQNFHLKQAVHKQNRIGYFLSFYFRIWRAKIDKIQFDFRWFYNSIRKYNNGICKFWFSALLHYLFYCKINIFWKICCRIYFLHEWFFMFVCMKSYIFSWLIILLVISESSGRDFRYLRTEDGLTDGEINSIVQDGAGNMWFATWSGLINLDWFSF